MAELALRQVVKRFDDVEAVRSIDLDIPDNEFVVLVGPSGCGKSTTLRMIAGLEEVTSGDICIDGAGHLQMLLKIFIPVALPGIIAATIFAFTVSWAAFVYPMAFLYSSDQQVLTVGTVTSLIRADVYKWGMLMAGALVAAAPPLVIYAFLMDYYIAGLTAGATKG